MPNNAIKRYNSINTWLLERFGERVYKVSLESGCGCPVRDFGFGSRYSGCIYCNRASLNPASSPDGKIKPIGRQLEDGIAYLAKRHRSRKVIAHFQHGSNTCAETSHLAPIFREAISNPAVVGLAISTRPDCIETSHLDLLEDLSRRTLLWVELGLQSAHNETLVRINRGHTVEKFSETANLLRKRNIPVCAHVILGLPGETPEMMIETARYLNETKVWGVKIHNLHVLRDTELERLYNEGEIEIPSLETYAGWVVDFLEFLDPEIVIHRVNSHSPRSLTVAPGWSINKLRIFNEVEKEMEKRNSWQGKGRDSELGTRNSGLKKPFIPG